MGLGQTKNVVNATRVFPKIDKVAEFEKGLANHAKKYHVGDWKWRVYQVQSGPDAGAYHISEGPNTWDQIDSRGNLGEEHMADWNKNIAQYLTDRGAVSYALYREDLSTVPLGDFSDKIAITHVFPKMGYGDKVEDAIKMIKKAWEAGNQTVAVYEASASGPAQYSFVYRYKQGLKERNDGFRKPFKERYEMANGDGSFNQYMEAARNYVDKAWSELLFYRADLSSK
jgi:hypothetical protein